MRVGAVAALLVAVLAGCGAEAASEPETCPADLTEMADGDDIGVYGPSWSPDGTRIAFTTGTELLVVTLADCSLERVEASAEGMRVDWPDWSPDGEFFAFVGSSEADPEGLYVMPYDGSRLHLLVEGAVLFPSWSPDGERIAFIEDRYDEAEATEDRNVWFVTGRGPPPQRVTTGSWHGSVDWSPDGTWLLTDTGSAVVKLRPDGSGRTIVIPGDHPSADWSPDGETIAVQGLALAPADGGPLEPVETVEGGGFEPAWSPDGKWIAFSEAQRNLWIVRPDGEGLRQLTTVD